MKQEQRVRNFLPEEQFCLPAPSKIPRSLSILPLREEEEEEKFKKCTEVSNMSKKKEEIPFWELFSEKHILSGFVSLPYHCCTRDLLPLGLRDSKASQTTTITSSVIITTSSRRSRRGRERKNERKRESKNEREEKCSAMITSLLVMMTSSYLMAPFDEFVFVVRKSSYQSRIGDFPTEYQ